MAAAVWGSLLLCTATRQLVGAYWRLGKEQSTDVTPVCNCGPTPTHSASDSLSRAPHAVSRKVPVTCHEFLSQCIGQSLDNAHKVEVKIPNMDHAVAWDTQSGKTTTKNEA